MSGGSPALADAGGAYFHPVGRVGRGGEVGRVIVFVATEDALWMTGVDLAVDGGFFILGLDQGVSPRTWFERIAVRDDPP